MSKSTCACVRVDTCDMCAKRALGVMHYQNDTPVLFGCRHCHPSNFELTAKQEVARWIDNADQTYVHEQFPLK